METAVAAGDLGRPGVAPTGLREIMLTCSRQLVEQRFSVLEIGGVEALGEPAIDRRDEVARVGSLAPVAPKPSQVKRGFQLERLGALLAGDHQRPLEAGFSLGGPIKRQRQHALQAMQIGIAPVLARPPGQLDRLVEDREPAPGSPARPWASANSDR